MANASCIHHWCERQTTGHGSGRDLHLHESKAQSAVGLNNSAVSVMVSYEDGDRDPLLFVGGGDVELKADGVAELIAFLQEQLLIMRSVDTSPLPVAA